MVAARRGERVPPHHPRSRPAQDHSGCPRSDGADRAVQDLAAIFGLVVALVGILLAHFLHQPIWDALASVFVGLSLGVVAIFLGRESMSLLVGEAVPQEEHARITEVTASFPGVLEVIHIRTLHIAPQEVLGAFKIRFARDLNMDQLEAKINDLESRLRAEFPHLRRIYIEPGFDESKAATSRTAKRVF